MSEGGGDANPGAGAWGARQQARAGGARGGGRGRRNKGVAARPAYKSPVTELQDAVFSV